MKPNYTFTSKISKPPVESLSVVFSGLNKELDNFVSDENCISGVWFDVLFASRRINEK